MSLLMNAIRTVIAARNPLPASGELPAAGAGDAQPPDARVPGPAVAGEPPAWHQLSAQTGIQDQDYGEHGRPGVQALFGHAPRRLLDVGCATGAVGATLKKLIPGLWVWGCELNAQAAQVAAGRLDRVSDRPREQWTPDEQALVGSVDTVLLLDVLEHMYNPWAELQFLASRLPRDAQVVVSLPNVGHIAILEQLSRGQFRYERMGILDVTHMRFFTPDGMLAMFDETGFDVELMTPLSRTQGTALAGYPARVNVGRLAIDVDTPQEWERLQTIQYGFRLRPRRPAA